VIVPSLLVALPWGRLALDVRERIVAIEAKLGV